MLNKTPTLFNVFSDVLSALHITPYLVFSFFWDPLWAFWLEVSMSQMLSILPLLCLSPFLLLGLNIHDFFQSWNRTSKEKYFLLIWWNRYCLCCYLLLYHFLNNFCTYWLCPVFFLFLPSHLTLALMKTEI